MTIENTRVPINDSFDAKIAFLVDRMELFHSKARALALRADDRRRQWRESAGRRQDTKDAHSANANATNDPYYKDLIADQQMYDRWTMREAAMIQALLASRQSVDSARSEAANPVLRKRRQRVH